MEIWREVKGYVGIYQVSNTGIVKSLDRVVFHSKFGKKFCPGKTLSQKKNIQTGYLEVNLHKDNKPKTTTVHTIVFHSFNDLCKKEKYHIDHIDNNKENNFLENLRYIPRSENLKKSRSLYNGYWKNFSKEEIEFIRSYTGQQKELCKIFNCSSGTMSQIINYKSYK